MPDALSQTSSTLRTRAASLRRYAVAHKGITTVAVLVVLGGAWYAYGALTSTTGETRYILGTAQKGTLIATVTGSGQISANQSLDVTPTVSGQITYVGVKSGQHVGAGALIAEIDSTEAEKSVRDAKANVESAQLALQRAQGAVNGSEAARNDLISLYLDLPGVMTGLDSIAGRLSSNQFLPGNIGTSGGETYRKQALADNDAAQSAYTTASLGYEHVNLATASDAQVSALLASAKNATALAQTAVASANTFYNWYEGHGLNPNAPVPSAVSSDVTTLNADSTKLSTHLSAISSDTSTLTTEPLDLASSELDLTKAQNALTDAQATLAKYYIRAPFAGTIGTVSAHVYDQAGSAALATLITTGQVADLSVNEVDAAKIAAGQKATLTFDAIPDLSLTGKVAVLNPIGTVTQGVVSYDVQIALDALDPRVKTGMTVNAAIQTAVHQDALTVPSTAVKTQNGQSYVLAFNPPLATTTDSTGSLQAVGVVSATAPTRIPVEIGISDDTSTEILSGLDEGQQIVVRSVTGAAQTTPATTRTGAGAAGAAGGNRGFGGGGAIRIGG